MRRVPRLRPGMLAVAAAALLSLAACGSAAALAPPLPESSRPAPGAPGYKAYVAVANADQVLVLTGAPWRVSGRITVPAPHDLAASPLAAVIATQPLLDTSRAGRSVTVAAVQDNVPRLGLDFNAQRRAVLDYHVARTGRLGADVAAGRVPRPDLVIWPENSSDIDPLRNLDAYAEISRDRRGVPAPARAGTVSPDRRGRLLRPDHRGPPPLTAAMDEATGLCTTSASRLLKAEEIQPLRSR